MEGVNLYSWGMYPKIKNRHFSFKDLKELSSYMRDSFSYIPYGNGRSYGDACLNDCILYCKPYNFLLDFDTQNGIIHCQSGVLLAEIIKITIPRGWFLKITPGTKYITVGGAIASDVHGKNHHIDGCFSESLLEFRLMLPSGEVIQCKKGDELFHATCGGMGLTGVIIAARIQLKKIKSKNIRRIIIKTKNLTETFECFEKYASSTYSVAWVDCLTKGKNIGRSIFTIGEFIEDGDLNYKEKKKLNIPFTFPGFILNRFTVKAFNYFYYHKFQNDIFEEIVDIDNFFYPLDSINYWNRIYGKNGFLQYHLVIPRKEGYTGIEEILWKVARYEGGCFLGVLKFYGKENNNLLSFPLEGYGLALDFKINKGVFELLNELDKIVVKYGGRIYLAKDARMSRETFEAGYHNFQKFKEVRKKYELYKKFQSLQSRRLEI